MRGRTALLAPALILALPVLIAGCRTGTTAYAPVENVRYAAIGQDPFWMVTIGDDRIVLRLGGEAGEGVNEAVWPRTLPRTVDGVRTWESGEGTRVIAIESRPGPCTGARGRRYQDNVRVRLSGRELTGCGGRLLADYRE
ncbi:hypothetical protein [Sphingosinicella terrae]|jgi:uncharacterized membrane protein|uniref:hypothetical protein n=1 Tax=Sphingosinicella terrae TaxID=2172047 RepID=UPI000E0D6127|nr:hypothetical protein [Sphingosinicella terrae]